MRLSFAVFLFFIGIQVSSNGEVSKRGVVRPDAAKMRELKDYYTFTSTDGRSFAGKLVLVELDTVTIERHSDGKEFTLPMDRFIEMDREYMVNWAKQNPGLNIPGRSIDRIYLRCFALDSSTSRRSRGHAFASVTYSRRTGVWTRRAGQTKGKTIDKTRSVVLQLEASSISGPVLVRMHTFFFSKLKDSSMRVYSHHKDDVLVDRNQGELVVSSKEVYGYYGYGCVAVNLVTGTVMAIDASQHTIEDYLEAQAKSGKYAIN